MPLSYNGRKIIPAPLVNVNKVYYKSGDGSKTGTVYELSLTGTLLPFKGSPSGTYPIGHPSQAFWTLSDYPPDETYAGNGADFASINRKQEALRWLFSQEGKSLEWQGVGGQPVVKCNPRIKSIIFPEGIWADKCDYSVELEADWIYVPGGGDLYEDTFNVNLIVEATEDWQFQEQEGHNDTVFSVTHNVSAKSILGYDETGTEIGPAWSGAKTWCDSKITGSVDSILMLNAVGYDSWIGGSYSKSTSINERDGSCSIVEAWIISPNVTFTDKSFSISQDMNNDIIDVSYNGTIYGISDGTHTGNSQAIANAKSAVPTNAQAKTEATSTLTDFLGDNVIPNAPTQKDITINNNNGTVAFSFNWSAGEDSTYTQENEATLSFNSSDGLYEVVLTVNINGVGEDNDTRLTNAKAAIPTDADARILALTILSGQIPGGVTISTAHVSKSTAINEGQGSVQLSWTWNSSDENNVDVQVEITYPQIITAQIVIPGRIAGPIIQKMNTRTAQQVSVTYNSENNSSKPDSDTIAVLMNTYGGVIDYGQWHIDSWVLENDRETWNPITGKYSRTRTHTIKD